MGLFSRRGDDARPAAEDAVAQASGADTGTGQSGESPTDAAAQTGVQDGIGRGVAPPAGSADDAPTATDAVVTRRASRLLRSKATPV